MYIIYIYLRVNNVFTRLFHRRGLLPKGTSNKIMCVIVRCVCRGCSQRKYHLYYHLLIIIFYRRYDYIPYSV